MALLIVRSPVRPGSEEYFPTSQLCSFLSGLIQFHWKHITGLEFHEISAVGAHHHGEWLCRVTE